MILATVSRSVAAAAAGAALGLQFFSGSAAAATLSDGDMKGLLNAGGVQLAVDAAPMWFFGQALNQPPCYPTWALGGGGGQVASGGLCAWRDAGCNCRRPGVGIGNQGPSFPVYFSYRRCGDAEVRVAYNLFYEKDGFTPDKVFGHP